MHGSMEKRRNCFICFQLHVFSSREWPKEQPRRRAPSSSATSNRSKCPELSSDGLNFDAMQKN